MNLKERAKKLKKDIPAVYLALKKPETPFSAKFLASLTIIYALSPIDLIPDFIPILGYLDDIILLPALIALTVKLIPKAVFQQCKEESEGLWDNQKPKKWYYALPILFLWLILILLLIKGIDR